MPGQTCRQHDAVETADTNNEFGINILTQPTIEHGASLIDQIITKSMHLLTVSFIISNSVYSSDNQISCNDATTVFSMVLDFLRWPGKAWKWHGMLYWLKCTNPVLRRKLHIHLNIIMRWNIVRFEFYK